MRKVIPSLPPLQLRCSPTAPIVSEGESWIRCVGLGTCTCRHAGIVVGGWRLLACLAERVPGAGLTDWPRTGPAALLPTYIRTQARPIMIRSDVKCCNAAPHSLTRVVAGGFERESAERSTRGGSVSAALRREPREVRGLSRQNHRAITRACFATITRVKGVPLS